MDKTVVKMCRVRKTKQIAQSAQHFSDKNKSLLALLPKIKTFWTIPAKNWTISDNQRIKLRHSSHTSQRHKAMITSVTSFSKGHLQKAGNSEMDMAKVISHYTQRKLL